MHIKKITIQNYKCFKNKFSLILNEGLNIIVGNNEAGKSTILEALHLALSGMLNGRYLKNELSQYLFNKEIESEYIASLKTKNFLAPPFILIEVLMDGKDFPMLEGDGSSEKGMECGISFKIEFDNQYQSEYEKLIKSEKLSTIPIEYYKVNWYSSAREAITQKSIPMKSVLIDSSATKFQNGSDVYIAKIIKDDLEDKEIIEISQSYRKMKESFMADKSIETINNKITGKADISDKSLKISVDLSPKNSWETVLMTYLDDIPFHQIGKGEQCIIKTNLALAHKKAKESNLIIIEEPENHLSHSKLNEFVRSIKTKCENKQIVISTHNSFIANKLGLQNLIILNNRKEIRLNSLSKQTREFFEKLPGFETLRLVLCNKAILVEGPSDELIVQKAYMVKNLNQVLPIENGIDVISVGLSFKRFLEIAEKIEKSVAVVTDNDGDYAVNIKEKYKDYKSSIWVKIFADDTEVLNTLEPQIVNANKKNLQPLYDILGIKQASYGSEKALSDYMILHKTTCALKIFDSTLRIGFPEYINKTIIWAND